MGGKSATMMYAFPFTLCRRAVVATMDNAANNLDYFNTHHWLSNRQNVMLHWHWQIYHKEMAEKTFR